MPDEQTPDPDTVPANPPNETPAAVVADLTRQDLDDLFRDLAACADLQHIAVKSSPGQRHAHPASLDLVQARAHLDQPTTYAVQLRYRFDGDLWIDTLTSRDDHYHLMRVHHA